jgi:exonuclease III
VELTWAVENEITEMRIATWNVCRLYRPGEMNEVVKEMDKYEVDICALQEIRWPQKGTMIK